MFTKIDGSRCLKVFLLDAATGQKTFGKYSKFRNNMLTNKNLQNLISKCASEDIIKSI